MAVPVQLTGRAHPPTDGRWTALPAVTGAAAAVVVAAALGARAGAADPALVAVARGLIVGVPLAVGIHTFLRRPERRFGALLAALGALLLATTLAESSDAAASTAGRAAGWLCEVLVVYVVLAFPTGRLPARSDRLLVAAMALVVGALLLPRLLLDPVFATPGPSTSCVRGCPPNALFAAGAEPAPASAVLQPLGVLLVLAVMVAVVVRMSVRTARASRLARRMFVGVVAVAAARAALVAGGFAAHAAAPHATVTSAIAWTIALTIPVLALAFLLGLLQWRLFAARALSRLGACLDAVPDPATLRRAFADAFADPSMAIVFPGRDGPGRWTDPEGAPVEPGDGRSLSEVRSARGDVTAGLVHDAALDAHPELLHAATAMAGVALDNQRLAAQARTTSQALRDSRARIATSAERERRRIERDLHDGAQQQLVALRIELELAEELVRRDPDRGASRLVVLERRLDEALEELRSLAHGVYPSLLADRGLGDALRALVARSSVPVDLRARDVGRYAPEVESAVYFCVSEALQNVMKHATGARRVALTVDGATHRELRFTVRDDGPGGPGGVVHAGSGITNMRDRLWAVDGELDVLPGPKGGLTVRGRVAATRLPGA